MPVSTLHLLIWERDWECLYLHEGLWHQVKWKPRVVFLLCESQNTYIMVTMNAVFSPWDGLAPSEVIASQLESERCDPMDYPVHNTGVGSLSLLQGIFWTQESNRGLLHCRRILYQLSYQGSPDLLLYSELWCCSCQSKPLFSLASWCLVRRSVGDARGIIGIQGRKLCLPIFHLLPTWLPWESPSNSPCNSIWFQFEVFPTPAEPAWSHPTRTPQRH